MADKLVCNDEDEVLKALRDKREFTLKTTLTILDLGVNNIGDEGAKSLSDSLKENTTLTILNLGWNNIGESGAKSLSDSLKVNTTLTKLNLSFNDIGESGAKSLSDSLKGNTTLTELNLDSNNIGDEGAKSLSDSLKGNTTLTKLDLGQNDIGDSGATSLSDSLKGNNTLTILNLGKNNIGESGAKSLSDSLKVNTTLTVLGLNNNNIGDSGAKSLSDSLKGNNTLTALVLGENNIGDEGAKALLEAMKLNYSINQNNNKYWVEYFIGNNKCSASLQKALEGEIQNNQDQNKVVVKKKIKNLRLVNEKIQIVKEKVSEIEITRQQRGKKVQEIKIQERTLQEIYKKKVTVEKSASEKLSQRSSEETVNKSFAKISQLEKHLKEQINNENIAKENVSKKVFSEKLAREKLAREKLSLISARKVAAENSPILFIEKKIREIFNQFQIDEDEIFEQTIQCFLKGNSVDILLTDFIPSNDWHSVQKEFQSLHQRISEFYSKKSKTLISYFLRQWNVSQQGIPEKMYFALLHSDTKQVFQILGSYIARRKHNQLQSEIDNLQMEFVNAIPRFIIDKEKTKVLENNQTKIEIPNTDSSQSQPQTPSQSQSQPPQSPSLSQPQSPSLSQPQSPYLSQSQPGDVIIFEPTIRKALIITMSKYMTENFKPLCAPPKDGEEIQAFLSSSCGFNSTQSIVWIKEEYNSDKISEEFRKLDTEAKSYGTDNKILYFIYYSGHGTIDKEGKTQGHTINGSEIDLEKKIRSLATRPNVAVISLLDCCRVEFKGQVPSKEKTPGQLALIHATEPGKVALGSQEGECSEVTKSFINQMKQSSLTFPLCIQEWAKSHKLAQLSDKMKFEVPLKLGTVLASTIPNSVHKWTSEDFINWLKYIEIRNFEELSRVIANPKNGFDGKWLFRRLKKPEQLQVLFTVLADYQDVCFELENWISSHPQ